MTKRKQRGTPRRRPRKRAPKAAAPATQLPAVVPAPGPIETRHLGSDIALGELGLMELALTPEEEAILSEPVPADKVLVKPTGQPYLPHTEYTRWFHRAFGRTGWSLIPVSKPFMQGKSVVCPYVLHVHRVPVAFAMGEQEFFEANKDQSYGDALESTVASALRRCAKRLGVGLELWDRAWLDAWLDAHTVKVFIDQDGKKAPRWRLKGSAPFWNELPAKGAPAEARREARPRETRQTSTPASGYNAAAAEPITTPQVRRLGVIFRNSGRAEAEVQMWLKARYGWNHSTEITRDKYDEICRAIEAPGELPTED